MSQNEETNMKIGAIIIEGKTKIVHEIVNRPFDVFIQSKDRITAGDGTRAHQLLGKAAISNQTNDLVFSFLNKVGIKTHYISKQGETSFIARRCAMIPIEWVSRRVATGSFVRRHTNVKEGFRFNPPKQEIFYKDDANHDPQWCIEELISAKLNIGGKTIDKDEIEYMRRCTICIFEVLEKAWSSLQCVLVDMKIEFGVDLETGEILLADVIDSDSWRLWPHGDKRLMKDKQVYRDLKEVTSEALSEVKSNFGWVVDTLKTLRLESLVKVVVLMGSPADISHGEKIRNHCTTLGLNCHLRVTSAHKGTAETLKILAEYEGMQEPLIFIAVAGRSNGLGPVLSGNTAYPVINCPPLTSDWGKEDIWSSLRLPSGLGCSTVLSPEGAAQFAAHIVAVNDHMIWSKLRARQLNHWFSLNNADKEAHSINK